MDLYSYLPDNPGRSESWFYTNEATGSGQADLNGDGTYEQTVSDNAEVTVNGSRTPAVEISISASVTEFNTVGDAIVYTVIVTNTGNVDLSNVIVTDILTGYEDEIANLNPSEQRSITINYKVTQEDINTGSIVNTASVTATGLAGESVDNQSSVTINGELNPDIEITKNVLQDDYRVVGEEISYEIIVYNTGNVILNNIVVADPLIPMTENISELLPGASSSFDVKYSVKQSDLDNKTIINTATASVQYGETSLEVFDDAVISAILPPVANEDVSSDHLAGTTVTINILANDLINNGEQALPGLVLVDLNPETPDNQTGHFAEGEGTWSYNAQNGVVTFVPEAGFTTDPTPLTYVLIEEATGLSDTALITIDYNEGVPFAVDDISNDNTPGQPVSINILSNDRLSDGSPVISLLVVIDLNPDQPGPQHQLVVPGEGTWTLNALTGVISFSQESGFRKDPTPIIYTLTEILTGLSDEGTITITYIEKEPEAIDDLSTGNDPGTIVSLNILENDKLGDNTDATPDLVNVDLDLSRPGIQDMLEVEGEGAFIFNPETGIVTFTPEPGFVATTSPVSYSLEEILTELADTANITISFTKVPSVAADDASNNNNPGDEVRINILENDLLSDGTPALPDKVTVDLNPNAEGIQTELIVAGEGTWNYNINSGELIYMPAAGFFADPTPITYSLCNVLIPGVCDDAKVTIDYDQGILNPGVALVKTGVYNSDDESILYTFNVINTGNTPVWDILITDALIMPGSLELENDTLYPGERGSITTVYQVTAEDLEKGEIINTAKVSGLSYNGVVVEDISGTERGNDTPTLTALTQNVSIEIVKETALPSPYPEVYDEVDFIITITNTGNVRLVNVSLLDPLTGLEEVIGDLLPGVSVTYETSYTVLPQDDQRGEFENTALVIGTAPNGNTVTAESKVLVNVNQCTMIIPNGFSPNDDNIQDLWRITCIEKFPDARVEIYNRWGNLVYEKENYGNLEIHGDADRWWDGTSTNPRSFGSGKLPAGTYYYMLFLDSGLKPLNGYIFLNR